MDGKKTGFPSECVVNFNFQKSSLDFASKCPASFFFFWSAVDFGFCMFVCAIVSYALVVGYGIYVDFG